MQGGPSRTAMMAAVARAGHLFMYGSRALLSDWMAWPLLGAEAETYLAAARGLIGEHAFDYATWHAARIRISEDWLAASQARQYVILGAGLDSFAWRQGGDVAVYEFDHPATQGWKLERLEKLGVPIPSTMTMVEADFERQSVEELLEVSSVDLGQPIFVSWLGVIPYLTADTIVATLNQLPPCTIATSYLLPESGWDASTRTFAEPMLRAFADLGEPLLTSTTPEETAVLLERGGFHVDSDLGAADVTAQHAIPCVSHERILLAHKR